MQGNADAVVAIGQGKDPRDVVTPYAFSVSDELIGTMLATPTKRGIALLIDGVCIFMLTHTSSIFLAGFVAVMFYRAGSKVSKKTRYHGLKLLLRFMAALMLFVFALGLFDILSPGQHTNEQVAENGILVSGANMDSLKLAAASTKYFVSAEQQSAEIASGKCQPQLDCWGELLLPFVDRLQALEVAEREKITLINAALAGIKSHASAGDYEVLRSEVAARITLGPEGPLPAEANSLSLSEPLLAVSEVTAVTGLEQAQPSNKCSLLDWSKGIATDLGLGFGWAAFYFTAFTVWLGGYTPGKKVTGIKIVKLDGSKLNLWESFGRYGGYGAGFATGLLGFLQIFWDPNRQAIQDKIAETLVIDTYKPKVKVTVADHE